MFTSTIDLIRGGVLTAPPAAPGAALRVIQVTEIYPYHLCRYPDRDDLEYFLSCRQLPDPFDKLLVQVLAALEAHSNSFPKAGSAPPPGIMNLAASLSLQITQIPHHDPDRSIENGVMYLNKILHTSPYISIHQFLLDAYMAATKINEHVKIRFNKQGSTDTIKNLVFRVYERLLRLEVDIQEAWHREHQFLTRPENVTSQIARSGQTNPNHVALDQETFASLGQAATAGVDFGPCVDPAILGGQADPVTTDDQTAPASQRDQTVQVPPPDLYNMLGVGSLEMGGRVSDWEEGFERKLRSIFEDFELGFTNSGDVFPLGESSYDADAEYEDVV